MRRGFRAASPLLAVATCSSGCTAPVDPDATTYAGVAGFPTLSAQRIEEIDGDDGKSIVLHKARVILTTDPSEERDLSVFRQKTIFVLKSRQRAVNLAVQADAELATQGLTGASAESAHPIGLSSDEYGLVTVGEDGTLSAVDPETAASIRLVK